MVCFHYVIYVLMTEAACVRHNETGEEAAKCCLSIHLYCTISQKLRF